jgi:hypothetical protein
VGIAPIPGATERHAVRLPLTEETVDLGEQALSVFTNQSAVAAENPDARCVGQ